MGGGLGEEVWGRRSGGKRLEVRVWRDWRHGVGGGGLEVKVGKGVLGIWGLGCLVMFSDVF